MLPAAHPSNDFEMIAQNEADCLEAWLEYWMLYFPAQLPDPDNARKIIRVRHSITGKWKLPIAPPPDKGSNVSQLGIALASAPAIAPAHVYPNAVPVPVAHLNAKTKTAQYELPVVDSKSNEEKELETLETEEEAERFRGMFRKHHEYRRLMRALLKPSWFNVLDALIGAANPARDKGRLWCWPAFATLAGQCNISRRTAFTAVQHLIQIGFIQKIQSGKLKGTSNGYELALPNDEKIANLQSYLAKVGCANCCRLAKTEQGMQKLALSADFVDPKTFVFAQRVCKICKPGAQNLHTGMQILHTNSCNKLKVIEQAFDSNAPTAANPIPIKAKPKKPSVTTKPPKAGTGTVIGNEPTTEPNPEQANRQRQIFVTLPYLAALMDDFSRSFGDLLHLAANRTQVSNLFAASGLTEKDFAEVMQDARRLANAAAITTIGASGYSNRAPYFFSVLRDMLGMKN